MFPPRRPSLFSHGWRRTAPAARRPAGHALAVVVGTIGLCVSLSLVQVVTVAVHDLDPAHVLVPAAAAAGTASAVECGAGVAPGTACAQPADLVEIPAATAAAIRL
ncbi:MAG: hypothetical protein ACTHL8_12435 [Burkholderiaceae bacterium]